MDIVQYLHGLVSPNLGEDVQADLLKQYYALSVCHMAQTDVDVSKQTDMLGLWGEQTQALIKRLSRSFHVSPHDLSTQLNQATPMMMAELSGLLEGQSWQYVLGLGVSALYLPAWAGEFISSQFVYSHDVSDDGASDDEQSDEHDENETVLSKQTAHIKPSHHKPKKTSPIAWGLGVLVLATLVGLSMGAWYVYQSNKETPVVAQNAPNSTLNPPRLLLTTGENGTLYGCLAEVGDNALQAQFMQIVQKNFGQVDCIIDIDSAFGSSLVGLERLESIIAMIKSEAFTSIEIVGGQIMVNHPKTDVLNRLVGDIGLLAPQFSVQAVPPLDRAGAINASIAKATDAINALTATSTPYQLVRAINLQHLDFYGTTELPAQYHAPLGLLAQKLIQNPTIKLIIVSHTDANNPDGTANVALSQAQAQAVKDFLVQSGVPESQLVAKGVGHAFAISDNVTATGQFKNRRVEFLVFDEAMMTMLSDKTNKIATTAPAPYERPQMVESAPYVPSDTVAPMPVNGMPPAMLPEPVQSSAQSAPVPQHTPPAYEMGDVDGETSASSEILPEPSTPNAAHTNSNIPQELLELSETSIGSDGVMRGPSYEIRK